MNMGLMVKRIEIEKDDVLGEIYRNKGDAVSNISFSQSGIILSWGEGDRFEISYEDFRLLQAITSNMERRFKQKSHSNAEEDL